jgi:chloride channel protein, CIC family
VNLRIPRPTPQQTFFILNVAIGLLAGGISIMLHLMIFQLMDWFGTHDGFTLKSFLYGGLSLLAGAYITTRLMPVTSGSGIPRTKILLSVHHGIIHTREWLTKIVTTVLSLSSGVPLGSEGPTIAIAAGIGSSLGRKFQLAEKQVKSLVYAGCAAGIAAAFNTPIAAVIFTMEEVIGSTSTKALGPILISSLVASVTAAALIGQNSVFTPVHYAFNSPFELLFYLAIGIVAALGGTLFIQNIILIKRLTKKFFKHHRLTLIMSSFLLVGALSQMVAEVPGNGLVTINNLLQGQIVSWQVLLALLMAKFIACAFCYGAAISGGILMPVLFLGAALGGLFGSIAINVLNLDQVEIGAYCLVGMGAFFASVIRTPFTSIILVFEMTRDYRIVLPLMLANLTAYFLSEWMERGSVYEKIALYEGYELPSHDDENILEQATVEDVYVRHPLPTREKLPFVRLIYPDQSLSYAMVKLKRIGGRDPLKVVNRLDPGMVLGEITLQNIFDHIKHSDLQPPAPPQESHHGII